MVCSEQQQQRGRRQCSERRRRWADATPVSFDARSLRRCAVPCHCVPKGHGVAPLTCPRQYSTVHVMSCPLHAVCCPLHVVCCTLHRTALSLAARFDAQTRGLTCGSAGSRSHVADHLPSMLGRHSNGIAAAHNVRHTLVGQSVSVKTR